MQIFSVRSGRRCSIVSIRLAWTIRLHSYLHSYSLILFSMLAVAYWFPVLEPGPVFRGFVRGQCWLLFDFLPVTCYLFFSLACPGARGSWTPHSKAQYCTWWLVSFTKKYIICIKNGTINWYEVKNMKYLSTTV